MPLLEDIDQDQVCVGAAGDDAEAVGTATHSASSLSVGDGLRGVFGEGGFERLAEGYRLGGDDVHQRPALLAGEDAAVNGWLQTAVRRG